jgi:hypothetical protein
MSTSDVNGLRARARQRRTEPSGSVQLGASNANAYFTSKRIRQRVPRKAKPLPLKERQTEAAATPSHAQQTWEKRPNDEDAEAQEERDVGLQLPSRGELLAELRAADEHVEPLGRRFEELFPTWKSELLAGYNLLFYGVGSKLSLLQVSCGLSLRMNLNWR